MCLAIFVGLLVFGKRMKDIHYERSVTKVVITLGIKVAL